MDDLKNLLDVVQKAFTIIGLIVGGVWAYYKLVKGRVFKTRLEPAVSGELVVRDGVSYLHVTVSVKNVGLSKADLSQEGTALRILGHRALPGLTGTVALEWEHLGTFPIFAEHHWIEPGEIITEDKVVAVPGADHVAFLLDTRLVAHRLAFRAKRAVTRKPEPAGGGETRC